MRLWPLKLLAVSDIVALQRAGWMPALQSGKKSVADFGLEGFELGMAQAVAADEIHNQKHQQPAANHDHHGDLQSENQVGQIVQAADDVGPENSAKKLRREHVHADRGSVRTARLSCSAWMKCKMSLN